MLKKCVFSLFLKAEESVRSRISTGSEFHASTSASVCSAVMKLFTSPNAFAQFAMETALQVTSNE